MRLHKACRTARTGGGALAALLGRLMLLRSGEENAAKASSTWQAGLSIWVEQEDPTPLLVTVVQYRTVL